jgi:hypothetical protein
MKSEAAHAALSAGQDAGEQAALLSHTEIVTFFWLKPRRKRQRKREHLRRGFRHMVSGGANGVNGPIRAKYFKSENRGFAAADSLGDTFRTGLSKRQGAPSWVYGNAAIMA